MPNPEWKCVVIELPVTFLSFGCLYLGILGFKSEQNICMLDLWIFNLRWPRGLFIWSIRFSQIYIFSTLFSFYRPPKDRTKLALNLDSWKTIFLKIIALFLSFSFLRKTFNFLSLRGIVSSGGEKHFSISSFWIGFRCVFRLYFLVFSEMLSVIVKEWKFCCIRFRLVLWSRKINSSLLIQFSWRFSCGKE